jgi:hypothetical protein
MGSSISAFSNREGGTVADPHDTERDLDTATLTDRDIVSELPDEPRTGDADGDDQDTVDGDADDQDADADDTAA